MGFSKLEVAFLRFPDGHFPSDPEADDFGGDIWITPPKGRGKIIACSGLGVNWNAPVLMDEGVLLQPGDTTQKFQNVPSCLIGMSYFGHPINVSAGNWNIEFEPPLTLYVWVMDGFCDSLEQVMPLQGWTLESAPGFQTDDGYKLHLLSKYIQEEDFYTGRWESFRTISSSFCGGLVGTYPLPKQPEVVVSSELPSESMVVGEAQELGGEVMGCSGLDIEWNAPHKMMAGALVNPGLDFPLWTFLDRFSFFLVTIGIPTAKRHTADQATVTLSSRTYLLSCRVANISAPGHGPKLAHGPSSTKLQPFYTCGSKRVSTMPGLMMPWVQMVGPRKMPGTLRA